MRFSHNVITGPLVEPVSLAEVRQAAHINYDVENALLQVWIAAAREEAEHYQRRAYLTQTLEMSFDVWPPFPVTLYRAPLQSVTSVKYYGTDDTEYTLDSSYYYVDTSSQPGRIGLGYSVILPTTTLRPTDSVKVRYVAGDGDNASAVPAKVKNAIYVYCSWMHENRTGEAGAIPQAFYDLLRTDALWE